MIWDSAATRPTMTAGVARPIRIEPRERRVSKDGTPVELSPLLWRLLAMLAERPGQLVTRGEIKRQLWPYAIRIDTERRLNTAMRALRAAIGDDAEAPAYIQTVRGEGYRWIASAAPSRHHARIWLGAIAACAVLLLGSAPAQAPAGGPLNLHRTLQAQAALADWQRDPSQPAFTRAAAAVEEAANAGETPAILVLDAQLALGGRWDWEAAERRYRRALAMDPGNSDARLGLAWLEANRGESDRAFDLVESLSASSVLSDERRADLGWLLIRLNRAELASSACALVPDATINLLSCAHVALAATGRLEEARHTALLLMSRVGADGQAMLDVETGDAATGYALFLRWRAQHFLPRGASWFQRAQVLADAGDRKGALDALGRSIAAHEPLAVKIGSTPSFASLKSDHRFRQLADRVGVPL